MLAAPCQASDYVIISSLGYIRSDRCCSKGVENGRQHDAQQTTVGAADGDRDESSSEARKEEETEEDKPQESGKAAIGKSRRCEPLQ